MEPLTIQRDVVKHGVRLDCLIEGMAYSAEREEVRNQRLAGVECVEIAEKNRPSDRTGHRLLQRTWAAGSRELSPDPPNMTKGEVLSGVWKTGVAESGRWCSVLLLKGMQRRVRAKTLQKSGDRPKCNLPELWKRV